jgi:uncharacterized protein YdhG (YjbR/CyaY superfamily)
MSDPSTVDEYIAASPERTKTPLGEIRRRVHQVVPEAGEKISYRIPTFTLGGKYFAYMAASTTTSASIRSPRSPASMTRSPRTGWEKAACDSPSASPSHTI